MAIPDAGSPVFVSNTWVEIGSGNIDGIHLKTNYDFVIWNFLECALLW